MFSLPNTIKQLGSLTILLLTLFTLQGCDSPANDVLLSPAKTSAISESIDDHIGAAPSPIVRRNLDRATSIVGIRPARRIMTTLGVISGGDPMARGSIRINNISGRVRVHLTGSHPSHLYEIYWVAPDATTLTADAIYMGNIVTDNTGAARGEWLRDIVTYADILGATPVDTRTRKISEGYPPRTRGWFLFFSRGPFPPTGSGPLPNPPVNLTPTPGDSSSYMQYISTGLRGIAE